MNQTNLLRGILATILAAIRPHSLVQLQVDPSIAIVDPDDTHMEGATVAITSGFSAGDQLVFHNQNGITGNYNGATGVLTLTGHATKSAYEAALESVEFVPGLALLNILQVTLGQREITYRVNDGDAFSAPNAAATALIDVQLGLLIL